MACRGKCGEARLWGAVLTAIPLVLAVMLGTSHSARLDLMVTVGLGVFGFAFAVISSLHSYLILACLMVSFLLPSVRAQPPVPA